MIWRVARKEFLGKVLDFRVTSSFVIGIALAIVSVIVAKEDFQTKKTAFDLAVTKNQTQLSTIKVFSQYKPDVILPPSPLSIFSRGIDLPSPLVVGIRLDKVPRYEEAAAISNPFMQMYDSLDIATVLRVLFSLLVVLLTYDLISGEKETGTLRLMMANPISRVRVLLGKVIGVVLIIGVAVTLTFLTALTFLETSPSISLGIEDYARLFLMMAVTLLYLSFFAILGALLSLKFTHSSTSLVVSLLVWFVIVVVQPDLDIYFAAHFKTTPRIEEVKPSLEGTGAAFFSELVRIQDQCGSVLTDDSRAKYPETTISYGHVQMYTVVPDADYDILMCLIKQTQAQVKLIESADQEWSLYESLYEDRLNAQVRLKRVLDSLSPAALFSRCVAVLARTEVDNCERFFERAREYRRAYIGYLTQKGIFSTNAQLFFSQLRSDQVDPLQTAQRIAAYLKDPRSIPWSDKLPSLDLSDAPIFEARGSPLGADSSDVTGSAFALLICALSVILWASRSLRSYDVR